MILKILDYRNSQHDDGAYEEWNYFDNIVSASSYYDEDAKMTAVRCVIRGGNIVTFDIPNVAYLMSDNGKTIEKIMAASVEEIAYGEDVVYNTLLDAANAAMTAD